MISGDEAKALSILCRIRETHINMHEGPSRREINSDSSRR
jgi:hypothetical protein